MTTNNGDRGDGRLLGSLDAQVWHCETSLNDTAMRCVLAVTRNDLDEARTLAKTALRLDAALSRLLDRRRQLRHARTGR